MTDDQKTLKIKVEAERLRKMYTEDVRQKTFNALVLGKHGSGKTFMLRTARKPVHIDSFDPGGAKGLRDLIESGDVIVDTRYEAEKPRKPFAFDLWCKEMAAREQMGYFNSIGTYCIDSATTWSDAIMNSILKKAGLAGEPPRWAHDFVPQKVIIENWLHELLALPCDFFLTGHLEGQKDEVSGQMFYQFMTTGKGAIKIPLLFDEIYVMDPKKTSSGVEYRLLTQATGTYTARSRLAANGLLETYEQPDIKNMLRKVKLTYEDKPKLF